MSEFKPFQFSQQDVEILQQETVYQGHFRVDKYILKHKLFAGGWSKPVTRELFKRTKAAGALLFDPVLNKIVMIEQFRVGAIQDNCPWLIEIVAGVMDVDETVEQLVSRETREEAGLEIRELISICEYWVSPGGSSEKASLFCARVDASKAGGIYGLIEEGEDIRVHVFDLAEAYQALNSGKICNAASIIALQWLQLNESQVRKAWLK